MGEIPEPERIDQGFSAKEVFTYAVLCENLHAAALRLGMPAEGIEGGYDFSTSAAGEKVGAIVLPEQPRPGLAVAVAAIDHPSRRMQRAFRDMTGVSLSEMRTFFTVYEPGTARSRGYLGAQCHLSDGTSAPMKATIDLSYPDLATILERGGMYEKASVGQRMGRYALLIIQDAIATQATLNGFDRGTYQAMQEARRFF